ncbi:hypothetical protein TNIN_216451 [Trichonephila inaurata madagascariensis]|uniref:Uncharacterized protein n=1 Tax=Trichonephila inaurata madagascariensis TaxID=2747483 RepID=A0A8X6XRH3_9ARAC|nr:hypothetical protein TNIN_216451 [Trichonephila inaurata madagascariensis]
MLHPVKARSTFVTSRNSNKCVSLSRLLSSACVQALTMLFWSSLQVSQTSMIFVPIKVNLTKFDNVHRNIIADDIIRNFMYGQMTSETLESQHVRINKHQNVGQERTERENVLDFFVNLS